MHYKFVCVYVCVHLCVCLQDLWVGTFIHGYGSQIDGSGTSGYTED